MKITVPQAIRNIMSDGRDRHCNQILKAITYKYPELSRAPNLLKQIRTTCHRFTTEEVLKISGKMLTNRRRNITTMYRIQRQRQPLDFTALIHAWGR